MRAQAHLASLAGGELVAALVVLAYDEAAPAPERESVLGWAADAGLGPGQGELCRVLGRLAGAQDAHQQADVQQATEALIALLAAQAQGAQRAAEALRTHFASTAGDVAPWLPTEQRVTITQGLWATGEHLGAIAEMVRQARQ